MGHGVSCPAAQYNYVRQGPNLEFKSNCTCDSDKRRMKSGLGVLLTAFLQLLCGFILLIVYETAKTHFYNSLPDDSEDEQIETQISMIGTFVICSIFLQL